MVVRTEDDDIEYQPVGAKAAELDRYAEITLEDGGIIIYDRDNENAWVQSQAPVELQAIA